ncbi:MAG TPA: hypothetical protein PKN81_17365 [Anaerolineales bacterium]|nr:hypothetical protein [Anaerolineales bacterium]
MRKRNWRLVGFGIFLLILAIGFYFFMATIAPTSLDPVTMMETVGSTSGTVGGLSIAIILIGLIGKKA